MKLKYSRANGRARMLTIKFHHSIRQGQKLVVDFGKGLESEERNSKCFSARVHNTENIRIPIVIQQEARKRYTYLSHSKFIDRRSGTPYIPHITNTGIHTYNCSFCCSPAKLCVKQASPYKFHPQQILVTTTFQWRAQYRGFTSIKCRRVPP